MRLQLPRYGSSGAGATPTADLADIPPVHTVDLPDSVAAVTHEHAGVFTGLYIQGFDRVRQHRGDGLETALGLCADEAPERPLFFIDGDHSAEAVTKELLRVTTEVPAATVLMHDTCSYDDANPSGPGQALRQLLLRNGRYNVLELKSQTGMTRLTPRRDHDNQ